jgi:hypothetical protein
LHTSQPTKESHKNQAIDSKKKLAYSNPLRLALEWKKGLETGRYASQAAIAREHGISRARVTQLMNLLKISPAILQMTDGLLIERRIRAILKGT